MRYILIYGILLVIAVVIVIPAITIGGLGIVFQSRVTQSQNEAHTGEDVSIKVFNHATGEIITMNLEDYVKGVVAAEMPGEFELEALKAQAVAARTYAVKHMAYFGGTGTAEHPGADVSSDPKESQAWQSDSVIQMKWGRNYKKYWSKVTLAVDQTRGLIVTYNGEPINAVFHSTSGNRTASAKEVWGFDYPYLRSVACTWDQNSPKYHDVKEVTLVELETKLGTDAGIIAAAQDGNQASIVNIINRTESGRVDKVRIGNKIFSGLEVREKLDLRSSLFDIEPQADKLIIKTVGYGHGVGLCQYGANGQAKKGRDFRQILTYYYTGVAIRNIFGS
ncbi:amidase enhancer precursor [Methylomusa anaerophila]|uniref:Amidase enhancer n=1 Tax=Methylomusa anaerophila TaxID=1930071 RepID=A0A348AKD5_9FIRM|nr:amidase enhancer precursor [Methylomusa anaerophila]